MKRSTFPGIATLSLACIAALATPQRAPARDINPLDPLDWLQEQEITADDGAPNAEFGVAVALHGTTAMVGAQQASIGGNEDQGAVYVFDQSGSGWTQSQKLTSSDGAAFDTFGDAVAFQGDTAIVGAYAATVNDFAYQGTAYVFTRSNGTWSQAQKLAPDDGTDFNYFGYSVALDGTTAFIGADLLGAVYVFQQSGGTWAQSQKLTGSDEGVGDIFGYSVAIEGSTAFVGAYGNNGYQGAVYVFTESGGTWTETQKLTADDGTSNDLFRLRHRGVGIDADRRRVGRRHAIFRARPTCSTNRTAPGARRKSSSPTIARTRTSSVILLRSTARTRSWARMA